MNWLFWQMSSTPYLGGGFGHFYSYAPEKLEYPIDRFAMETKRQMDLLNKHLENKKFICADQYTISDIAIWSWYGQLTLGKLYSAAEFLDVTSYKNGVPLNAGLRIACVLVWPLGMLSFLWGYYKGKND